MLLARTCLALSIATLLVSPPIAGAKDPLGKIPEAVHTFAGDLTLDAAVKIAVRQNPDLLKQLQEIERTRGQIIEVRAEALPHLRLNGIYDQRAKDLLESGNRSSSGSFSTIDTTTVDPAIQSILNALGTSSSGSNRVVQNKSWQLTLQAQQVLYAGGQVRSAIKIAKFADDAAYFQLRDVVDRVIATVRSQFTAVLTNRALIKVAEETVRLQADQLRDQKNRFEAGTVARFNVLRAEVELANVQPDLIRARNNYLLAEIALAKTLSLDPGLAGKPAFQAVGNLEITELTLGLQSALELGRARRPFLKVQRQQILQQTEQIKVAMAGYKPRLDANAGWEVRNSRLSEDLDKTVDGWFFGVTGSWNIFDGLATSGRVKQARASLESAKINYDDSVQKVDLEVQTAYANLQTARETIRSQQKNVEQANESLRLANERFAAGAGTQLEVLDARTALTKARSTELQSRGDYNTALAEFDRATATDTIYAEPFRDPLEKLENKVLSKTKKK